MNLPQQFNPPLRLLMGPGPSLVAPTVYAALSKPTLGHLDPEFLRMMDESKEMLRAVYNTRNEMTFPVSGTGTAGMEFCCVNLIEPGDDVIIGINGVFGARMAEIAGRCGARVTKVEAPWGEIIGPERFADAFKFLPKPKLVGMVHAETSTGVLSPVEEISRMTRDAGALFLLDTVTSLGGCPVLIDEWGVDAVYSATQKCLGCPPGLSPVSLSARALEVARVRKTKVQSWYLDATLLASYWGQDRAYHHTAPINMNYALHEGLRLALIEGLDQRYQRHQEAHSTLVSGLEALGLELASQKGHQLWQLNAVKVPEGVDELQLRRRLLSEFGIEVGAGLGPLKGKIFRVGLMGETARREHVKSLLDALRVILAR